MACHPFLRMTFSSGEKPLAPTSINSKRYFSALQDWKPLPSLFAGITYFIWAPPWIWEILCRRTTSKGCHRSNYPEKQQLLRKLSAETKRFSRLIWNVSGNHSIRTVLRKKKRLLTDSCGECSIFSTLARIRAKTFSCDSWL